MNESNIVECTGPKRDGGAGEAVPYWRGAATVASATNTAMAAQHNTDSEHSVSTRYIKHFYA